MTKQELAWLVVRSFGIYFLLNAILELFALAGVLYVRVDSEAAALLGNSASRTLLLSSLLKLISHFVLSVYLLRGGGILFRLLSRESK